MKIKKYLYLPATILFILFTTVLFSANYIEREKESWKVFYHDVTPDNPVKSWFVPFNTSNRTDIKTIRVISTFGAHRYSYIKGHMHTGLDNIPKKKGDLKYIFIYPMAHGVVCSIHLGHPHKTIVIKHELEDGSVIFTSYKHLQEIYVKPKQQVTPQTKLARLYTQKEAKLQDGSYDHLHLEIRKKFDDYGTASWATMTKEQLNKRFYDPLKFMKDNIKYSPK
ncbi:MAG: peptidoglycan DD-metalloendopeptidase family protein [Spirochaetes bacterium]|nr:peptidoglycan DD-metalloendopeptidase family protein [Spirochaetota bacterium]